MNLAGLEQSIPPLMQDMFQGFSDVISQLVAAMAADLSGWRVSRWTTHEQQFSLNHYCFFFNNIGLMPLRQ